MQQDLSDESRQQNHQTQLDVPDNKCRSWTDGDTVVHEASGRRDHHLAGPARRRRDLRKELRGTEVLEAIMAGVVVTIAISVFLGGVMVGVLAVMAIAIRREDRHHTLVGEAPDRLSRNTRRLTGMTRVGMGDEFLRPVGQLLR
jgi:hypothetical protein